MLSVEMINRLASDNEKLLMKLAIIQGICTEPADNMAILEFQSRIKAIINEQDN